MRIKIKRILLLILPILLPLLSISQSGGDTYDGVFDHSIHSVKFHLNGLVLSYPIIELGSRSQLSLSFDKLDEEVTDYIYTLTHCNADWKSSDLSDLEYLEGFNGERILDYEYSFRTIVPYTHYRLLLPNSDIRWTKSGNYLLQVYEDTEERPLVIRRRFVVVEPVFRIIPEIQRPAKVSKSRSHQEIDFKVNHKGIAIQNPQLEVKVVVLQNGIWQNAKSGLHPLFQREESLIYDYQDKLVFPAGKEFRSLDMRSLRSRSQIIREVIEYDDAYEVYLYTEKKRTFKHYSFINDINGQFVIENLDQSREVDRRMAADLGIDFINFDPNNDIHNLEGDYAYVYFSVDAPVELQDTSIYVFGSLSDWRPDERFKMKYNHDLHIYEAEVLLKQGFYNYYFAALNKGIINLEHFEGNWYQTENTYTILVYYRPFGQRYDRLVAVHSLSSSQ